MHEDGTLEAFEEELKNFAKCPALSDLITLKVTAASFFHIFFIHNNQINYTQFSNNQHFRSQLVKDFSRTILIIF